MLTTKLSNCFAAFQKPGKLLRRETVAHISLIIALCLFPVTLALSSGGIAVYLDDLEPGWQNWSWDTDLQFDSGAPVHSGTAALAVTYTQAWAGLSLQSNADIDTSIYGRVQFWIHGGSSGDHQINLMVRNADDDILVATPVPVTTTAGTWTQVDVPLADLGAADTLVSGLVWQEVSGAPQPTFYLDDVVLVRTGDEPPGPGQGPTLTVDIAAGQHSINPAIYGMNFADPALEVELSLPVERWGGNATTRYNWQLDATNLASDWFFLNWPYTPDDVAALPLGSTADQFVAGNRAHGTQTIMTMPLIGWTAKSRNHDCGFPRSLYPDQEAFDGNWDCGNGRWPDGTPITGNDPHNAGAEIDESFVQAWIGHLTDQFGTAAAGGVAYYALDNEPMLWHETHRDVHPDHVSYDELRDRTYQYAAAIKTADPTAQTLGPVLFGWTAYFYSALDTAPGGAWWENPQDQNAHGGTPFVEWYLQEMAAYEQAHDTRILDYLDLHFYPQNGVSLTTAGSDALQALRLRSTRALWDPTYVDESWIDEPVYLIPRMRAWVDAHYAGTRLAISEYNWGGLEHINGALAQADILGIFGREGVDLATLWDPPAADQPGAYAFRLYRNYDGNGAAFCDQSVAAASGNQEELSIYAARCRADGSLTLMVINKSARQLTSAVALAGLPSPVTAEVYRYSSANLNAIEREPDQAVGPQGFSAAFPAESITLFVMPSTPLFTQFLFLPLISH